MGAGSETPGSSTPNNPNPFRAIGLPPEGAGPREQLRYLEQLVLAFENTQHPRLKPLRKRLHGSLEELARGNQRGVDPMILAKRFAHEISELQLSTYELLAAIVSEVRVKLKSDGAKEQQPAISPDIDGALEVLVQVLRRLVAALRRGDPNAVQKLAPLLDEANLRLERAGGILAPVTPPAA